YRNMLGLQRAFFRALEIRFIFAKRNRNPKKIVKRIFAFVHFYGNLLFDFAFRAVRLAQANCDIFVCRNLEFVFDGDFALSKNSDFAKK
ncbi:hypothetical protein VPJ68_22520, partial [Parabacteroides distasonis]